MPYHSRGDSVVCIDLKLHRQRLAYPFHGIIGMDFLRTKVVRMDFDRRQIDFLSGQYLDRLESNRTFLPMAFDHTGRPYVQVQFGEGISERCLVDTGAIDTGYVPVKLAVDKLFNQLTDRRVAGVGYLAGLSGRVERTARIRYPSVTLGEFKHQDLVLTIRRKNTSLLGVGYWSPYQMLFDFPRRQLLLDKSSRYNATDRSDLDGMEIGCSRSDKRIVVVSVLEDSHAANIGVMAGDEVVFVDDWRVDYRHLRRVVTTIGFRQQDVRLTLKRGGQKWQVVLPE